MTSIIEMARAFIASGGATGLSLLALLAFVIMKPRERAQTKLEQDQRIDTKMESLLNRYEVRVAKLEDKAERAELKAVNADARAYLNAAKLEECEEREKRSHAFAMKLDDKQTDLQRTQTETLQRVVDLAEKIPVPVIPVIIKGEEVK